jgi:hypothetical protein
MHVCPVYASFDLGSKKRIVCKWRINSLVPHAPLKWGNGMTVMYRTKNASRCRAHRQTQQHGAFVRVDIQCAMLQVHFFFRVHCAVFVRNPVPPLGPLHSSHLGNFVHLMSTGCAGSQCLEPLHVHVLLYQGSLPENHAVGDVDAVSCVLGCA